LLPDGSNVMPEISRFFGIIITMNYNDHAPPHFIERKSDAYAQSASSG
jgi:hypothetical protein